MTIIMNNKLFFRALAFLVSAVIIMTCSVFVSAQTETSINLGNADKNLRGDGYEWNNPERVLTLDGLEIVTSEDFGLKIPDNCTVVLKGTNTIKSAKYGLGVPGSVVFKGSGKLIIESGVAAVYNYSYSDNHKMRFGEGSFTFTAETAILADRAEVSVTGGSLGLVSTAALAADTRVLSISGGSLDAVGTLKAEHLLGIDRADVTVTANGAALESGNLLKIENVKLKTGSAADSLSSAEKYNGENALSTSAVAKGVRASILFGDSVPITVDYLLLAVAVLLIAAAIVIPIMHKKAKVRRLYAGLDAEKARAEEEKNKGGKKK